MKVKCPITGLSYTLAGFADTRIPAPHPVFSLPVRQLARLESSAKTQFDQWLILFAYAHKSHFVRIIPEFTNFPETQFSISEYFPELSAIAALPESANIPKFSLSFDTVESFFPYLRETAKLESKYSKPLSLRDYDTILGTIPIDPDVERSRYLRSKAAIQDNITWTIDNLLLLPYFTESDFTDLKSILTGNKERISATRITELRNICVESLPEHTQHDLTRKTAILAILNEKLKTAPKNASPAEQKRTAIATFKLLSESTSTDANAAPKLINIAELIAKSKEVAKQ